ncbi:hypothetical protein D3C87_1493190 [compost metagenome]
MHKTGVVMRRFEQFQLCHDLLVVGRGDGPRYDAHRPDLVHQRVRATQPFASFSFEEIGVQITQHIFARVDINRIFHRNCIQVRQADEPRNARIVHHHMVSETICLECIDLPEPAMVYYRVLFQRSFHFRSQRPEISRQLHIFSSRRFFQQFGDFA